MRSSSPPLQLLARPVTWVSIYHWKWEEGEHFWAEWKNQKSFPTQRAGGHLLLPSMDKFQVVVNSLEVCLAALTLSCQTLVCSCLMGVRERMFEYHITFIFPLNYNTINRRGGFCLCTYSERSIFQLSYIHKTHTLDILHLPMLSPPAPLRMVPVPTCTVGASTPRAATADWCAYWGSQVFRGNEMLNLKLIEAPSSPLQLDHDVCGRSCRG